MTLQEKTKKLLELREEIGKIDTEYKTKVEPLKEARDEIQGSILENLKQKKEFSVRFDFATVTRAVRKTLKIIDEPKLVSHLKTLGLMDYISERVNNLFTDSVAKEVIKQNKEMPGTEIQETEYISISRAKEEKERRKVTVNEYAEKE